MAMDLCATEEFIIMEFETGNQIPSLLPLIYHLLTDVWLRHGDMILELALSVLLYLSPWPKALDSHVPEPAPAPAPPPPPPPPPAQPLPLPSFVMPISTSTLTVSSASSSF